MTKKFGARSNGLKPVDPVMAAAVAAHQGGRSAEAAAIYSKILEKTPSHFDALHLLGVIALQNGEMARAKDLITAALAIAPKNIAALNNLGTVYLRSHDYDAARRQYERVLQLDPKSVDALINVGSALLQLGRSREAVAPLQKAHAVDRDSAVTCNLLGACLLNSGDPNGAAIFFEKATLLEPDSPGGWSNLAAALTGAGRLDEARPHAQRAVAMQPNSAAAIAARAAVEFEEGDVHAALDSFEQAATLPDVSSQIHNAYANALWSGGRWEDAQAHLREAIRMDPYSASSRWKLAVSHCRAYYTTSAEIDESRAAFATSLEEIDQWFDSHQPPDAFAAVGSTQPFYMAYHHRNNRDLLARYGQICAKWMASMPLGAVRVTQRSSKCRLRIGIVSAHIRDHSVWNAITKGWISQFDKSRFETWLFHVGRIQDSQSQWARGVADKFVDDPATLQAWAACIKDADVDVLIYPEIGMDAMTTQLAALRLAPLQAASWGHPETSGLPTLDAYLSADALEPPNAQDNYSEALVRLPNLGVYVEPLTPSLADPELDALGLSDNEPLLLCPGTPYKYTPASDQIWARIAKGLSTAAPKRGLAGVIGRLRRAGYGKLVFFRSGNASADTLLERRLRCAFDTEHVDFDVQVRILPHLSRSRFFGLMQRSTLMLDTVGFSGFNNALQALEAGLPVLAREASFMRGRLASGIMRRLGLDELVAESDEVFVARAVELAVDPERISALRVQVAARRAMLFNDSTPVRALENWITTTVRGSAST